MKLFFLFDTTKVVRSLAKTFKKITILSKLNLPIKLSHIETSIQENCRLNTIIDKSEI